jgi:hypothetical protein
MLSATTMNLDCLPLAGRANVPCQAVRKPKPFRFLRDSKGETRAFSGRAPTHHKQRKRRKHLGLQALSLGRRFLIGGVQIHSPRPIISTYPHTGKPAAFSTKSPGRFVRLVSETSRGRVTVKVEPSPSVLSTSIVPPRRSTNFLTI